MVAFALLPLIPTKKNIKEWRAKRQIALDKKLAERKARRAAKKKEEEEKNLMGDDDGGE